MRIGICISLLIILTSCKNEVRFDSAEWNKKSVDWEWTEQREKMVVNLIKSDTLIGLQKNKILELLGNPSTETEKRLKYLVREKYEWNIDPEYIKYLWVELDKNGKATKCYIEKIK